MGRSATKRIAVVAAVSALLWAGLAWGQEDPFTQGHLFLESHQFDAAIEAFDRSLEILPRDYEAYNSRGIARIYKGEYERAVSDFTKAIEYNPKYADAYANRGAAYFEMGEVEPAIADYQRALEINPHYAKAYNNRGYAWSRIGDAESALADYRRALEIDPQYPDAYNNIAWLLATWPDQRYRDGDAAVKSARKAVELNPSVNFLDTLAAAYAEAGNFDKALATQQKVLEQLKTDAEGPKLQTARSRYEAYRQRRPLRQIQSLPGRRPVIESAEPVKPAPSESAPRSATASKPTANENHPFTIQIGSYRNLSAALQLVGRLAQKGDPIFISRADIPKKGIWYRAFIGNFVSIADARTGARQLKARNFKYAEVTRKPFALQITPDTDRHPQSDPLDKALMQKGFTAYTAAGVDPPDEDSLRIGAFATRSKARQALRYLEASGFRGKIVRR